MSRACPKTAPYFKVDQTNAGELHQMAFKYDSTVPCRAVSSARGAWPACSASHCSPQLPASRTSPPLIHKKKFPFVHYKIYKQDCGLGPILSGSEVQMMRRSRVHGGRVHCQVYRVTLYATQKPKRIEILPYLV